MKVIFPLAFLIFFATSALAQGLRIGFKGGANFSNLSGDLGTDNLYDSKLGLHGGVMFNFNMLDRFLSIQPEILYSNKGYVFNNTPFESGSFRFEYDGRVNYSYLDVPVLLKVNSGALFFELGPQVSYLLHVRQEYTESYSLGLTGSTVTTTTINNTSKEGLNRLELGYAAGVGFQAQSGVMLGVRYNGNFSRFAKETFFDGRLINARHAVFQLYLGFLLPG